MSVYIILLIITINIFSGPIQGFLGDSFGVLDDLMVISAFFFQSFLLVFLAGRNYLKIPKNLSLPIKLYIIFILLNLFISLVFKSEFFYPTSFIYELYKFSVFFFFIPLTFLNPKITLNVTKKLLPVLFILLSMNLGATILQHIFGPQILISLGIKAKIFTDQMIGHSQKTGLLPGKNITGAVNLYCLLITLIITKYKNVFDYYKIKISFFLLRILQVITFLGVILSESKNSIISLLIVIFIYLNIKNRYKFTLLISSFITLITYMYSINVFRFKDKVLSYVILAQNYEVFLKNISSIYGKGVEERGIELVKGMLLIIQNFPFGTGFGTWGDASASYNIYVKQKLSLYSELSDSYLSHIMVEQGLLAILYFYIIYLLTRKSGKIGASLFFTLIVFEGATMGRSSAIAPLIIAFIFALLWCIEKSKEEINDLVVIDKSN